VADVYLFADKNECMIPGCLCGMRPWRTQIQANNGAVVMWLCPCHCLLTMDAVVEMAHKDVETGEWRITKV